MDREALNDFVATIVDIPINWITWFMRIAVIVLPPVMYVVTKRICLGLQRRDREKVLHGRESGVIMVQPRRRVLGPLPLSHEAAYELTAHRRQTPVRLDPETDENGIPAPRGGSEGPSPDLVVLLRGRGPKPTVHELEAAAHHDGHGDGHAPELAELDRGESEPPGEHSGIRYRPAA